MIPDSGENWTDSEATYRAFEGSKADAARTKSAPTPEKTEEPSEWAETREPKEGTTLPFDRLGDDSAIPANAQGHLFQKYRVLHKLGGGGMGFVWLVEHVGLEQTRALKIIRSEVADDPVNLDRFRREARILAKLSRHPNAVQVYDTGFVGKFAYIEMDYLEGQTLKSRLEQDGVMPLADVAWFLGELCAVLGEAHAMGIVHRDIKPQNIMIVDDPTSARGERVKVLDFGIAKIVRDAAADTAAMTLQTAGFLGTYPYSSPEQLGLPLPGRKEAEAVDHRSDIYTVGVMLYEMLVGIRPFVGIPTKILYDHAHTPPPPFAEADRGAGIPAEVEAVVRRCLEKDPALRPQSVQELWESFRAAVGVISPAGGTMTWVPEQDTRPQPPTDDGTRPTLSTRIASALSRRKGVILGSFAAAAACLGLMMLVPRLKPTLRPDAGRVKAPSPDPISPWIADWLRSKGYKAISQDGVNERGWPRAILRTSGEPPGKMAVNGTFYLPADCEADSPSGTGAGGLPKVLKSRRTESRFILIEGDAFTMGAFDDRHPFDKDTEQPGHRVTLSSYYMQETEVSIGAFATFCADRGIKRQDPQVQQFFIEWDKLADLKGLEDKEKLRDHPATGVSHAMAVKYARWIGGDLPTEAQWEFAARSRGKPRLHVWSDGEQGKNRISGMAYVQVEDSSGPCEVGFRGNKDRTEQGLYHMAGNVREWCRDAWRTYRGGPQSDAVAEPEDGDPHPLFAIRGGSYETPTETARVTWRADSPGHAYKLKGDETDEDLGFRIVLGVLVCPPGPATAGAVARLEARR